MRFNNLVIKYPTVVKNAHHRTLKLKAMASDCLFCRTNSPKIKDIQFTIIQDKEKLQIITFKKLEAADVWPFCLKNELMII